MVTYITIEMKWFYDMQLHNDNKKLRQNPTIQNAKLDSPPPMLVLGLI